MKEASGLRNFDFDKDILIQDNVSREARLDQKTLITHFAHKIMFQEKLALIKKL